MLGEISDLIGLTEYALVSERDTLQAIEDYCATHSMNYNVILMAELGDVREGSDEKELCDLARIVERMKQVLGGASDYMMCDVTESEHNYRVGSVVRFVCDYAALSSGFANAALIKEVR